MIEHHDAEWGVPLHADRALFELLCLEGAQAGLSWSTVLHRREGYRAAFDHFDPARVAAYDDARRAQLLADPRIIRNRAKVDAFITNAQATLAVQREVGSLDAFVWPFVGGQPIVNRAWSAGEIPAETAESQALSKALGRRGYRFVGPVITYAFMQSAGLVNDHTVDCFRHPDFHG